MPHKKINPIGIFILLALGLGLIFFVLEITNVTHFFHSKPAVSGPIPVLTTKHSKPAAAATSASPTTEKNSSSSYSPPTPTPAPTDKSSSQPTASSTTTNQPLSAPFGSFVSNHYPNLSGSPAPSEEQSSCNTTPGAKCTITFTNDSGIVKTLPEQTTDSSGLAFWSWDVNKAGFTEGTWHIKATASLNGQSASSKDSLDLKVGP